jgi:L-lactate dehydrogenase complex protein LldF
MSDFRSRIWNAVHDDHLHAAIERATSQLSSRRTKAFASLDNIDELRDRARNIKLNTLAELDMHLERFEERLLSNGIHVHWAETAGSARQIILDIAEDRNVKKIVKAKSMVTEEIHLNDELISSGLEVLETDFGEYIVQLAKDRPSHIILPIIHMTREDVGKLFEENLSIPYTDKPEELARHARVRLRQSFLKADMGITGANFGVVEAGGILLVSNEGNIRMVTTLPRIHVAILGIEKLVPTLTDLECMLRLLPRSATGQKLTAYTSLIRGPRRTPDEEGPEEVHVILLDNGRSRILAGEQAEILACIRCGACLNTCPVYKSIGGHAYGDTYPGPVGSILTPALHDLPSWSDLPLASSLCGACRETCPVRIDIPRMLLSLRKNSVDLGCSTGSMRLIMRIFGITATRPGLFRFALRVGRYILKFFATDGWIRRAPGLLASWTKHRDLPLPHREPFHEWWRHRRKDNDG